MTCGQLNGSLQCASEASVREAHRSDCLIACCLDPRYTPPSVMRRRLLESEKFRLYRKRVKIDDHIVSFGVEATGALGPSAKALLWRAVLLI